MNILIAHTHGLSKLSIILLLTTHMVLTVCGFDLTILHTNDVHDRIEQTNKYSGPCSTGDAAEGKCYGGMARIKTAVDQERAAHTNTLLLDAGDQFQGTLWFYHYKGLAISRFMNHIGFDAMALGNHEFDNGVAGLIPFVNNVTFPVLSSNADFSNTPGLSSVKKSTVIEVGGDRIGIIGYTTKDTPYIARPETVTFSDELTAVQAEADRLTADGINKIIAVGHAGFVVDTGMAAQLRNVDVIVGGHSNTFLYNGEPPSNEEPANTYPVKIGDVYVVQDYAYGKYLGELHLTFDDQGLVTAVSGNPILLDGSIAQDNRTLQIIQEYLPGLEAMKTEVVGTSHVFFTADYKICRTQECSLANLVADSFVRQNLRHSDSRSWSDVGIAMVNSGAVRAPITRGNITVEHAVSVAPFRNTVNIVELRGSTVLAALEHSARGWTRQEGAYFGGWLQFSGMRVMYDMRRPVGRRVVDVRMLCTKCLTPEFESLNTSEVYQILMTTFISNGGDGYEMIQKEKVGEHLIGNVEADLLMEYIRDVSPLFTGLEGRIQFLEEYEESNLGRHFLRDCDGDEASAIFATSNVLALVSLNFLLIFAF